MNYTRQIYLDVNATSAVTVVKAKEGDDSLRYVNVILLRDGTQFVPDNGMSAVFRLEKPDGKAVVNNATIESDGSITVQLTAQCTAVAGRCKADVLLMANGETISTALFILEVVKSPDVANQLNSSDEFGVLADMMDRATAVVTEGEIKLFNMTLRANWSGNASPYTQAVTLTGFAPTANTRVDLYCDATNVEKLIADGVGRIYISNDNGTLTAYATNNKPTSNIVVQAVAVEEHLNS